MQVNESLKKLHDPWIERVVNKLGRSELGRDYLVEELERFFELLLQAVESDDPGWLNPHIDRLGRI